MNTMKVNTLRVPGASIYYEVRGSGPLLLLISGGSGDANGLNNLCNNLVDKYTVVTYDRRGLARSKIDDPSQKLRVEMESDDVHCLLSELSTEPVYVVGSSIGAVIALDLAARYPTQVCRLVAHEPPAAYLNTRNEQPLSETIQEILKREGENVAMKEFATRVGVNNYNLDVVKGTKAFDNIKFFIQKEAPMLNTYRFNFDALKVAMTKTSIIIGRGLTSPKDSVGYLGAVTVSEQMKTIIVDFPGDHAGMGRLPKEFAERLYDIIGD